MNSASSLPTKIVKSSKPTPKSDDGSRKRDDDPQIEFQEDMYDVLYRAALVSKHHNEQLLADGIHEDYFDLTFTSILLGFLASKVPLAQWFQGYVRNANVVADHMMSSKKIDPQALEAIASAQVNIEALRRLSWTVSANNIRRAAVQLAAQMQRGMADLDVGACHYMAAYIYHCPKGHEKQLAAWRFNRVNWSNAFLSYVASDAEQSLDLEQWKEIHRKTFDQEPRIPPPAQTTPLTTPDMTPLHLDSPSDADYLGRRGFAEALAVRLNRVWRECNWVDEHDDDRTEVRSSFVLHMHGPWGSGKTSLLKFLRKELQPPREPRKMSLLKRLRGALRPPKEESVTSDERLRWVVVKFNAWQHQRISPPWWPLLDAIYTGAARQLADPDVFGERLHTWRVRCRERLWRLVTLRRDYLTSMVVASIALAGFVVWLWHSGGEWDFEKIGTAVGTAVGTVAVVWSTFLVAGRTLLSGSARSAQSFMETAGDPMERICAHFRKLVGWVDKPVVIFIDDLDRCQPKYVIDLLEGVQTLFSDPRVVYVIAADRRWLNTCFETSYQSFADAVKEPGRRLGSLFLEKAFELSVSVPRLSPEMKQVYWDYLIRGAQANVEQVIEEESAQVQNDFVDAETEEQVLARLQVSTGDALRDQVRKGAAVRRLASRRVVASTEYFLKPFAPLLEPNPRAMKRLVNAYSVLRDTALLAGVNVLGDIARRRQLALWAIVSLRWPLLEEYLEGHPEVIEFIREGKTRDDEGLLIPDESLRKLAASEEVRSVFKGGETGTGLEVETVCEIIGVGIGNAQPMAAPVA